MLSPMGGDVRGGDGLAEGRGVLQAVSVAPVYSPSTGAWKPEKLLSF